MAKQAKRQPTKKPKQPHTPTLAVTSPAVAPLPASTLTQSTSAAQVAPAEPTALARATLLLGLPVGLVALLLSSAQLVLTFRQWNEPTQAELAGVKNPPAFDIKFAGDSCHLKSDDGRPLVGVALGIRVMTANTHHQESNASSVMDTKVIPELRFGETHSAALPKERRSYICELAQSKRSFWSDCKAEDCYTFVTCDGTVHRQADGARFTNSAWAIVRPVGADDCVIEPLHLHRSTTVELDSGKISYSWKEPKLRLAFDMLNALLVESAAPQRHDIIVGRSTIQRRN